MIYNLTNFTLDIPRIEIETISTIEQISDDVEYLFIDYKFFSDQHIKKIKKKYKKITIVCLDNEYFFFRDSLMYNIGVNHYFAIKTQEEFLQVVNLFIDFHSSENIQIDAKKRKVYLNDQEITLSKKEMLIYKYLFENRDQICTREFINTEILGYHEGAQTRIVDVYIKYIRNKLGDEGKKIETIRKKGYIYNT